MKLSRSFAYLFAIVAFAAGTSIGWANGELRSRDQAAMNEAALSQVRAQYEAQVKAAEAGNSNSENWFYLGVYAMCQANFFDVDFCNEVVGVAKAKGVYGDPYWTEGYADAGADGAPIDGANNNG